MDKEKPSHSYNTRSKKRNCKRGKASLKKQSIKSIRDSKKNIDMNFKQSSKTIIDKSIKKKTYFY